MGAKRAYNGDSEAIASSAKKGKTDHGARPRIKLTFLTLPGEIRNLIYAYCVEEASSVFDTDRLPVLQRRPRRPRLLDWDPLAPSRPDWQGQRRQFVGLTQVCRQIRTEFRHIYFTENLFRVRLWQYNKCIYDWFGEDDEEVREEYRRNVLRIHRG